VERNVVGILVFEDVTIEEEQGLPRTMARGSRYLPLHSERGEKGTAYWGTHVRRVALVRVALVREENKALGPWHIRLVRLDTQVFEA
jgi:hypothetical protein